MDFYCLLNLQDQLILVLSSSLILIFFLIILVISHYTFICNNAQKNQLLLVDLNLMPHWCDDFILWSGWWESNSHSQLGRLEFYHWTTPAFILLIHYIKLLIVCQYFCKKIIKFLGIKHYMEEIHYNKLYLWYSKIYLFIKIIYKFKRG